MNCDTCRPSRRSKPHTPLAPPFPSGTPSNTAPAPNEPNSANAVVPRPATPNEPNLPHAADSRLAAEPLSTLAAPPPGFCAKRTQFWPRTLILLRVLLRRRHARGNCAKSSLSPCAAWWSSARSTDSPAPLRYSPWHCLQTMLLASHAPPGRHVLSTIRRSRILCCSNKFPKIFVYLTIGPSGRTRRGSSSSQGVRQSCGQHSLTASSSVLLEHCNDVAVPPFGSFIRRSLAVSVFDVALGSLCKK